MGTIAMHLCKTKGKILISSFEDRGVFVSFSSKKPKTQDENPTGFVHGQLRGLKISNECLSRMKYTSEMSAFISTAVFVSWVIR